MIIECPSCHSKYQYDEGRFDGKQAKKIKCAKCTNIFEIVNPSFIDEPAPVSAGEQTFHSSRKKKVDEEPEHVPAAVESASMKAPPALGLPPGKRLSLAIIDGPDAGSVFRIAKPRVTVGRSGADITIKDTETSRQHAAVEIHDTLYTVTDLGSTNGTMVDGARITAPTELHDKGEFQIGSSTIMLIVTEDV